MNANKANYNLLDTALHPYLHISGDFMGSIPAKKPAFNLSLSQRNIPVMEPYQSSRYPQFIRLLSLHCCQAGYWWSINRSATSLIFGGWLLSICLTKGLVTKRYIVGIRRVADRMTNIEGHTRHFHYRMYKEGYGVKTVDLDCPLLSEPMLFIWSSSPS